MIKQTLPLLLLGCSAIAAETRIGTRTFTLPDGFEIESVAAPPLVNRPISAAFDEAGRLYVADSSGSNDKVEKQLAEKPHRIVRLEDSDGDGRFDRSVVFADRMMLPEGAMWLDGSLYVAAPPSIWKLTDLDGDGVAEHREEWFQGRTLTGCANDLHGPFPGPDGWIYWCKGAFAEQTHEQIGRRPIKDRAAHIFRARRDGSHLESVMSGGMDNPVEIAFTRAGEPIFTSTFIDLSGGGKRDGLGHAVYGGVFPKVHDVVDGVQRTGELLPAMTHFGPGAPSGLCRYEGEQFGPEFRDNLFATLFNLHKVTRHVLTAAGATFQTMDTDFVVSDNLDFHPTDVLSDADGSLLIVDTGGWYKLCCPTSQLAKPDVLGAIYRVRKTGAPRGADPRGGQLSWGTMNAEAMVKLLDDPRPAVATRASAQLVKGQAASIPALGAILGKSTKQEVRQRALWALSQIDLEESRVVVRTALDDLDPEVRQTAAKILGLWRDRASSEKLAAMVRDGTTAKSLHLQRVAAEALGRIGDPHAVPALLAASATSGSDRFFEHALIFALIELRAPDVTSAALRSAGDDAARRSALIALNEMEGSSIEARDVIPLLGSPSPVLERTARWIVNRHSDWGGALADYLRKALSAPTLTAQRGSELETLLTRSAADPAVQELVAGRLRGDSAPARETALRAIARAEIKALPQSWLAELEKLLGARDAAVLPNVIAAARSWTLRKNGAATLVPPLLAVARDMSLPGATRFDALTALPSKAVPADAPILDLVRTQLVPVQPLTARLAAANLVAGMRLEDAQREKIIELLPELGALEISRLMPVFEPSLPEPLARKLLALLRRSPAFVNLQPQALRPVFAKLPGELQPEAEQLLAQLNLDNAQQRSRLEALAAELPPGDLRRGQTVFQSTKATCALCHAVGYLGGRLGPDLSAIGPARSERDLLEAIVFPSASFVRSYEPMIVRTTSGEEVLGILRGENSDVLTLATGPATEQRIERTNVAEMRPGTTSLMPPGMDQILTRQELADLLAFLKGPKTAGP